MVDTRFPNFLPYMINCYCVSVDSKNQIIQQQNQSQMSHLFTLSKSLNPKNKFQPVSAADKNLFKTFYNPFNLKFSKITVSTNRVRISCNIWEGKANKNIVNGRITQYKAQISHRGTQVSCDSIVGSIDLPVPKLRKLIPLVGKCIKLLQFMTRLDRPGHKKFDFFGNLSLKK